MNPFNRLTELFQEFPGIGPRQAKRFVYFLLTKPNGYTKDLTRLISELKEDIRNCDTCFRVYSKKGGHAEFCSICMNQNRVLSQLLVVPRDSDLESIEKSGAFNGLYFVLGGTVPILEQEPEKKIRIQPLLKGLETRIKKGLAEVIIAMNANSEGENTADYLLKQLVPFKEKGLKITLLGRGLSTGTELEYSDAETLKNALSNRK